MGNANVHGIQHSGIMVAALLLFTIIYAASPSARAQVVCVPPPGGMVSWMPGDGNTNDIESGNRGIASGGVTYTTGKVGQAFNFDGTGDVLYPSMNLGNAFSVDLWVYFSQAPFIYQHLVSNNYLGQNYGALYLHGNFISYWQGGTPKVESAALPVNTWSHVALTYDGSVNRLYINGALTSTSDPHTETFNNAVKLGYAVSGGDNYFPGLLDEVEIFNRALTQAEIQSIVVADSVGKCKPQVKKIFDFDGDGKTDVSFWNPANHNWYIQQSGLSNALRTQLDWGNGSLGDISVPRDYDGDGRTDIAVWRPSEANWYILQSQTSTIRLVNWGNSSDYPVPADFDADGKVDVAVWRPSEGNWYIRNSATNTTTLRGWGNSSDIPVPGFYDADARADIAIYRPTEGNWYIINSLSNTARVVNWGQASDRPVPADFDGDGRTDLAVIRPPDNVWYISGSAGGVTVKHWGAATDLPVPGDYDGDGRADIAVFRPSEDNWYIIESGNNSALRLVNFGQAGSDVPAPSTFIPQ